MRQKNLFLGYLDYLKSTGNDFTRLKIGSFFTFLMIEVVCRTVLDRKRRDFACSTDLTIKAAEPLEPTLVPGGQKLKPVIIGAIGFLGEGVEGAIFLFHSIHSNEVMKLIQAIICFLVFWWNFHLFLLPLDFIFSYAIILCKKG